MKHVPKRTDTPAVILAGGLARRMQGRGKAFLELDNRPLITHIIDNLSGQTSRLALNVNDEDTRYAGLSLPLIHDATDSRDGPLAGVSAAIQWASAFSGSPRHVLTVPVDTPFLPCNLLGVMLEATQNNSDHIIFAISRGRVHPAIALWPLSCSRQLTSYIYDERKRRVMDFIKSVPHAGIEFDGQDFDPFFNINTPDDLLEAERIIRTSRHDK